MKISISLTCLDKQGHEIYMFKFSSEDEIMNYEMVMNKSEDYINPK